MQLSKPVFHFEKEFHDFAVMCLRYLKVIRPVYGEVIYTYESNMLKNNMF
jgi:hypothetical protein